MNMYEEIYQENMELLLRSLTERTLSGKQEWVELQYYPIGFVQDDDSDEREAYISQMFELETEFNGRKYYLDLAENISFPLKNVDIFGSITYETDEGERKHDFGLRADVDEYGKNSIKNQNARAMIIELANAVVAVFKGTDAEEFGFPYACYFNQSDIKRKWRKDKLVKLGEKLMTEKRMDDFHRAVLETEYREKLLSEINVTI